MSRGEKTSIGKALPMAERLRDGLSKYFTRLEIAGSIRRNCLLVGDIELVGIPRLVNVDMFGEGGQPAILHEFESENVTWLRRGEKYVAFEFESGGRLWKVDLFMPRPETWGVTLALRTGPADFSHQLVTSVNVSFWPNSGPNRPGLCPNHLKFIDARIFDTPTNKKLETPEERDVFEALGLEYVEPVDRR